MALDSRLSTLDYLGADEWNRTITASRPRASETRASTSSATSAHGELLMIRGLTVFFKTALGNGVSVRVLILWC